MASPMSSSDSFASFEQSSREYSSNVPRPVPSNSTRKSSKRTKDTRRKFETSCSPGVFTDFPVDTCNHDPSAPLLGCPYPEYSSVGVTVPANGQTVETEEVVIERVVDEYRSTGFKAFLTWYMDAIVTFRNSKFVHLLHLMVCHIPITAVVMGFLYVNGCPKMWYLPYFIGGVGIFGLLFLALWIAFSCCEYRGCPCSILRVLSLGMMVLLFIIVVVEMYLVCHLSPSFEPSAPDYCSKTFYYYLILRQTAIVSSLLLAALVYIPGSRLYNWCKEIPAPSPAGAFFHSL